MFRLERVLCIAAAALLTIGVSTQEKGKSKTSNHADIKPRLGLLPVPWPADNPYSSAKAELGRCYISIHVSLQTV